MSTENQQNNTEAMLSHLLALCGFVVPFGNILGPLVFWLMKKDQSPVVAREAKEALNFQITATLAIIVCVILMFVVIGLFLLPIVGLANLAFIIIAIIKSNKEGSYRYPFALRLIK